MEAPRCLSERTSGIVAGCKCVRVPHLITHELQIHFCLLSSQVAGESWLGNRGSSEEDSLQGLLCSVFFFFRNVFTLFQLQAVK